MMNISSVVLDTKVYKGHKFLQIIIIIIVNIIIILVAMMVIIIVPQKPID